LVNKAAAHLVEHKAEGRDGIQAVLQVCASAGIAELESVCEQLVTQHGANPDAASSADDRPASVIGAGSSEDVIRTFFRRVSKGGGEAAMIDLANVLRKQLAESRLELAQMKEERDQAVRERDAAMEETARIRMQQMPTAGRSSIFAAPSLPVPSSRGGFGALAPAATLLNAASAYQGARQPSKFSFAAPAASPQSAAGAAGFSFAEPVAMASKHAVTQDVPSGFVFAAPVTSSRTPGGVVDFSFAAPTPAVLSSADVLNGAQR